MPCWQQVGERQDRELRTQQDREDWTGQTRISGQTEEQNRAWSYHTDGKEQKIERGNVMEQEKILFCES